MDTGKITFAMAADWDRGFINDIQDPQDLEQFRSEKSVTVGKVCVFLVHLIYSVKSGTKAALFFGIMKGQSLD